MFEKGRALHKTQAHCIQWSLILSPDSHYGAKKICEIVKGGDLNPSLHLSARKAYLSPSIYLANPSQFVKGRAFRLNITRYFA